MELPPCFSTLLSAASFICGVFAAILFTLLIFDNGSQPGQISTIPGNEIQAEGRIAALRTMSADKTARLA